MELLLLFTIITEVSITITKWQIVASYGVVVAQPGVAKVVLKETGGQHQ